MTEKLKGLDAVLLLTIIFIFILAMFALFDYMGKDMAKQKDNDIKELTPECQQRCDRFDMTFYEMVNDGWLYDCWCIDNDTNKPFKVSTLDSPRRG